MAKLLDGRFSEDISPAEWREAFEEFKVFDYVSPKIRLFDMECIVLRGFWVLYAVSYGTNALNHSTGH